jgi:hypothetical protein
MVQEFSTFVFAFQYTDPSRVYIYIYIYICACRILATSLYSVLIWLIVYIATSAIGFRVSYEYAL